MSTTKNNHVNLTANPGPLGLCGFALTTWLLCLINAGIFDTKSIGLVLGMAFAFGGSVLGRLFRSGYGTLRILPCCCRSH